MKPNKNMFESYKIVAEKLFQNKTADGNFAHICCLCFGDVDADAVQLHDDIILEVDLNSDNIISEEMSTILHSLMGDEVSKNVNQKSKQSTPFLL